MTIVLLVAAALRFVALAEIPPGLYFDESANGVDALRVIGGWHPVFFPGDQGREPLVIYLQAAAMVLIGPSPMALRLPSAMLGVLTVAATYATFRVFAGRVAGLIGACLLAGSFWHVMLSRHAFRTVSLPLFMTIAAFWLHKGIRTGERLPFVIGGAALGLSLYTYIPARLAPPLFFAWLAGCVLIPAWRPKVTVRQLAAGIGLAGIVSNAIAFPLVWYFYRNPSDFIQRLRTASGRSAPQSITDSLRETLSGLFVSGDPLQRHDLAGRPLLDVVVTVLGMVGIALAARRWRQSPLVFAFVWCVAMLFPAALSGEPAHALRLVGELPFILLFPAIALAAVATARRPVPALLGSIAVVSLLVVGAVNAGRDYFVVWANRPITYDVFQGDLLHPLSLLDRIPRDASVLATSDVYEGTVIPESFVPLAGNRVRAYNGLNTFVTPRDTGAPIYYLYSRTFVPPKGDPLGARLEPLATALDPYGRVDGRIFRVDSPYLTLPADRAVGAIIGSAIEANGVDFRPVVQPGETATYALHWTVRGALPPGDWQLFVHLVERGQHRLIAQGYNHGFGPDQWRTGDRVVSWFDLDVPPDAPLGVADLNVGLLDLTSGNRLPLFTPAGEPAGNALVVGPLRITGPAVPTGAPPNPVNARFGSALTLEGYDVGSAANGQVVVRLYWQADATVASDFTAFVHVLDGQGRLVAGADSQPGAGAYPTSTWQAGDTFVDEHRLDAVPPRGTGTLEVGLYLLSTGQRLPADNAQTGRALGDAVRVPW
jgi:hypothetical protein